MKNKIFFGFNLNGLNNLQGWTNQKTSLSVGALNELNNPSVIEDTDAVTDETQQSALDKSEELNQLTDTFKKLSECALLELDCVILNNQKKIVFFV